MYYCLGPLFNLVTCGEEKHMPFQRSGSDHVVMVTSASLEDIRILDQMDFGREYAQLQVAGQVSSEIFIQIQGNEQIKKIITKISSICEGMLVACGGIMFTWFGSSYNTAIENMARINLIEF